MDLATHYFRKGFLDQAEVLIAETRVDLEKGNRDTALTKCKKIEQLLATVGEFDEPLRLTRPKMMWAMPDGRYSNGRTRIRWKTM